MPRRQRLTSLVVMGVAGSGKSSVMVALAERLGWPTLEGDDVHPPGNLAKMAAGAPLSDADRAPWLDAVAAWIGAREAARQSSIVTCSALRRAYRDRLRRGHPWVWFVHLDLPEEVLRRRLENRPDHFMRASMLDSQLATLEPLGADEPGSTISSLGSPEQIADLVIETLRLERFRLVRRARSSR